MPIRIASYNLENLFTRPSAMVNGGAEGQQAIDDHALANQIVAKQRYKDSDKEKLVELDKRYHFSALNAPDNALVSLNKVRGRLSPSRRRHHHSGCYRPRRLDWMV